MSRIKVVAWRNNELMELTRWGFIPGKSWYVVIRYSQLENWKTRRTDKKTEAHWDRIAAERKLNSYEEYQRKWNFIETDYNDTPSNNGFPLGSPAFAFHTSLVKYLKQKECVIIDGRVIEESIRYCEL